MELDSLTISKISKAFKAFKAFTVSKNVFRSHIERARGAYVFTTAARIDGPSARALGKRIDPARGAYVFTTAARIDSLSARTLGKRIDPARGAHIITTRIDSLSARTLALAHRLCETIVTFAMTNGSGRFATLTKSLCKTCCQINVRHVVKCLY